MIEHTFEPTGYYAEDGLVQATSEPGQSSVRSPDEGSKPWWVVARGNRYEVHKAHRGEGSDFCIAEINQWDDNAKKTATRIVHCVNLHDELVAVLELLLKWQNPIIAEHVSCVENAKALLARTREAK